MTRQHIKVLYWNIHGIYSRAIGEKNQDKELIRIVEEFDIICISELHTDKTISIPGFVLKKQKFRPKVSDISDIRDCLVKTKSELKRSQKSSSIARNKIDFARKITEQRMSNCLSEPSPDLEDELVSLYSTL